MVLCYTVEPLLSPIQNRLDSWLHEGVEERTMHSNIRIGLYSTVYGSSHLHFLVLFSLCNLIGLWKFSKWSTSSPFPDSFLLPCIWVTHNFTLAITPTEGSHPRIIHTCLVWEFGSQPGVWLGHEKWPHISEGNKFICTKLNWTAIFISNKTFGGYIIWLMWF